MSRRSIALLTGGPDYAHDFEETGGALSELIGEAGFDVRRADHPDRLPALLPGCAALVVNALRWRMLDQAYGPWRTQWAYATTQELRDAVARFVRLGGGLLANHTAPICFDDWPEWGEIVGGAWVWGASSHPELSAVTATILEHGHPVVTGLPDTLELVDEVYGGLRLHPEIDVLAVARRHHADDDQPVVWGHRYGRGRVVYSGFGHHAETLTNPDHRRMLIQALAWVTQPCDA